MTYIIKRTFAILFMAIFGSVLLYNCEPETDNLGEQLFLNDAAQGDEIPYDVIAYNIDNNDSIRSDANSMFDVYNSTRKAVLGAFKENQFGMQKASYLTQVRLPSYSPDFGTQPVVDSVILVIKPTYATDSLTTTTDENYIYPDGSIAAKKVVNTYPVYKYGKAKINGATPQFTIKVNEVGDFLNGQNDIAYSNTIYNAPLELGSKTFNGNVNSVTITKDSDASSLYTSSAVGIRIPLSASFFQTKIVDKASSSDLKDASNFIRYFKGIKLSVAENDGYLFQFNPDDIEMIMYYKNDKTENGTTTRPQTTYKFTMGSANTHIGHYEYDRLDTGFKTFVKGNKVIGDDKLYTQGMGGPSIGIKIPASTIGDLKQLYQNNKSAIIGARIRIYTDPNWNINYANYNNKYTKPIAFTIVQKDVDSNGKETTAFTTDLLNLSGSINFSPYKIYDIDKNPAYYDFTITKSLKDIVETGVDNTNKYFKIDLANFINTAAGSYAGYKYSSRAFSTDRAVFIGNDSSSDKKIQLLVVHSKK